MAAKPTMLTAEGLKNLEEELAELKNVKRKEIAETPAAHFVRRGFFRPAECAGKLPHAVSCGVFVAFVQATQHIYLNLDGRGLLLLGALKREWHFGMRGALGWGDALG